jgi:hypothetical protein
VDVTSAVIKRAKFSKFKEHGKRLNPDKTRTLTSYKPPIEKHAIVESHNVKRNIANVLMLDSHAINNVNAKIV